MSSVKIVLDKGVYYTSLSVYEANHANNMIEEIENANINQQIKNQIINALYTFIQTLTDITCEVNEFTKYEYAKIGLIYSKTYLL